VLGEERALVRVDATLNFERLERSRESYDPANTVVRSEERNESSETQTGATSENSVTNYEINKTVENIIGEIGGIKSLSVAVFVDGRYDVPAGGGEPAYAPLSEDEMTQIRRIVQTAVGLNAQRGDQIEVVNMQFQGREQPPDDSPGLLGRPWLERLPETIGKVLLFAVAAVMLLALKRNLGRLIGEGGAPGRRSAVAAAVEAEEQPMPSIKTAGGTHGSSEKMVTEVKEYANDNPEQMAELIHAWITESD
jgi:flagellar M-ring protein FliF